MWFVSREGFGIREGRGGSKAKYCEWSFLKVFVGAFSQDVFLKVFIWFQTYFIMFKVWFDDYDID